jgi:hypothetical protein
MKKSTLASIFAGLFTAAIATTAFAKAGHDDSYNHDGEQRMIKIKMQHDENALATIELNMNEGETQSFTFTHEELQDLALVEARLGDVDQETREALLTTLENLNAHRDGLVWQTNDGEAQKQVFVIKHGGDADTTTETEVDFDFISDGGHHQLHKIIEQNMPAGAHKMKFKFGDGGAIKLHSDPAHMASVIVKLLENAELTPEQIAAIQQSLDAKR